MNTNNYNYVIYHKGCTDGFASFIILTTSNQISDDALIYPDVPSAKQVPPNIKGKNIIIMDVAYKKNILEEIFKLADKVTFIDHHDSIKDDVRELIKISKNSSHEVIYDDLKSGASLTWKYLYGQKAKKLPLFIRYIEDNDIGAWKLKYTLPFISALRVKYNMQQTTENISKWKKLFNSKEVRYLIKKGIQYNEYQDLLLNENLKRYSVELFPGKKLFADYPNDFKKPGQYKVVVTNSACPTASLLGSKFVNTIDCDFCIIWNLNLDRNEYILQFRSKSADVGQIAKIFGGGGHIFASSCSIPSNKYSIRDLFSDKSLPRE